MCTDLHFPWFWCYLGQYQMLCSRSTYAPVCSLVPFLCLQMYMYVCIGDLSEDNKLYSKHAGHNDSSLKESLRCFKCSRPFSAKQHTFVPRIEEKVKQTYEHAPVSHVEKSTWQQVEPSRGQLLRASTHNQSNFFLLRRIFACTKKISFGRKLVRKYSWALIVRTPGVPTSSGWLKYSDTRMTHCEPRPSILLHVKVTNDVQSSYKCTSLAHNA